MSEDFFRRFEILVRYPWISSRSNVGGSAIRVAVIGARRLEAIALALAQIELERPAVIDRVIIGHAGDL